MSLMVLTRKERQAIKITTDTGEVIEVVLIRLMSGRQARIGIKCNRSFDIRRTDKLSDKEESHERLVETVR